LQTTGDQVREKIRHLLKKQTFLLQISFSIRIRTISLSSADIKSLHKLLTSIKTKENKTKQNKQTKKNTTTHKGNYLHIISDGNRNVFLNLNLCTNAV